MTELVGDSNEANENAARAETPAAEETADPARAGRNLPPPPPFPPTQQQQELPPGTSTTPNPYSTPADQMYGKVLATPITLDRVREVSNLDEMRKELLEEAKYIAEASAKIQETEAAAEATLKKVKQLETEYKKMVSDQKRAHQFANDPRITRNINFNTAPDAAIPAKIPVR